MPAVHAQQPTMPEGGDTVDVPPFQGPRPGALSLLTPAQRGLCLAIIQADRNGRGGEDLALLSGQFNGDTDAALQLNTRISMLGNWAPTTRPPPKSPPKRV